MHFKSEFFDKEWSIYFDDSGGGSVKIMEQQQNCTYGVNYHSFFFTYLAVVLGAPIIFVLAYMSAVCVCCGEKDAAERHRNLEHDAVDEPLLDEGTRPGL